MGATRATIKLMADYDCWPLWWAGDRAPGNLDPATLPLGPATLVRLDRWAAAFDAGLDRADPAASPAPSPAAVAAFEREGVALWRRLRAELGPAYQVVYHSSRLARVVADSADLDAG
jgi:hypothetical protein